MKTEKSLVAFEDHKIRRVYDEKGKGSPIRGSGQTQKEKGQSRNLVISNDWEKWNWSFQGAEPRPPDRKQQEIESGGAQSPDVLKTHPALR
jgi:hypothetical protein